MARTVLGNAIRFSWTWCNIYFAGNQSYAVYVIQRKNSVDLGAPIYAYVSIYAYSRWARTRPTLTMPHYFVTSEISHQNSASLTQPTILPPPYIYSEYHPTHLALALALLVARSAEVEVTLWEGRALALDCVSLDWTYRPEKESESVLDGVWRGENRIITRRWMARTQMRVTC